MRDTGDFMMIPETIYCFHRWVPLEEKCTAINTARFLLYVTDGGAASQQNKSSLNE